MNRPARGGDLERAPARLVEAEGQAELPGEIAAQEIGIVGAVGRHLQGVRPRGLVLTEPEVVMKQVPAAIARDLVKGRPRRALVRLGEEGLDPGRVQVVGGPSPALGRIEAVRRDGHDLVPALGEDDVEGGGRSRSELGRDPEGRPASPSHGQGLGLPRRSAQDDPDLGGVGLERGQDADGPPRLRLFRRDEQGVPAGQGRGGGGQPSRKGEGSRQSQS